MNQQDNVTMERLIKDAQKELDQAKKDSIIGQSYAMALEVVKALTPRITEVNTKALVGLVSNMARQFRRELEIDYGYRLAVPAEAPAVEMVEKAKAPSAKENVGGTTDQ